MEPILLHFYLNLMCALLASSINIENAIEQALHSEQSTTKDFSTSMTKEYKTPIEWQFQPDLNSISERFGESKHVINLKIGTPGQTIPIFLQQLGGENNGLQLNVFGEKDQFNPELSTTFEKINMTDGFKNSGGRDLVEVSKGETKSLPFLIYTGPVSWTQASELYLSRSTYNITNSFLTELLKDYKEKVVGITYEKSEDAKIPPGIKLTIGGRPKDVCGEWHYLTSPAERPYFSSENDWLVEMDGLKIDDKSVNLTNKVATFALTGYNGIRFGDPDEENIMPLLLEGHLDTDEAIKQMAEKEMVYEQVLLLKSITKNAQSFKTFKAINKALLMIIGGLKFRTTVKPKNFYMPKREPDPDEINDCRPPYEQNPHHILPHAVLYDKCLLLDFEKKLIAVANRK